jgi:hypothetical protein
VSQNFHLLQDCKYAPHNVAQNIAEPESINQNNSLLFIPFFGFSFGSHILNIVGPFNSKSDYSHGLDKYCDMKTQLYPAHGECLNFAPD